jgi:hypothetical protein
VRIPKRYYHMRNLSLERAEQCLEGRDLEAYCLAWRNAAPRYSQERASYADAELCRLCNQEKWEAFWARIDALLDATEELRQHRA